MDTLMKLLWLVASKQPKESGLSQNQWSDELLDQADKQYEAWVRLYARVVSNNKKLGTQEMISYSKKEREQLDIFVKNMEQFGPLIGGERGRKIIELHGATVNAIRHYDNFHARSVS